MKKVATFIGGFLVGIIVLSLWKSLTSPEYELASVTMDTDMSIEKPVVMSDTTESLKDTDIKKSDTTADINTEKKIERVQNEAVFVKNQKAGDTVIVNSINLMGGDNGGWVVVHEVKDGVIANALGAVRKDSGVHTRIPVNLLRGTVKGSDYAVVLYSDDGDKQFTMGNDIPLTENDTTVMSIFTAL